MSVRTVGEYPHSEELHREIERLKQQVESLTAALEEVRRADKLQAALFCKKAPKPKPQKSGRKPGEDYGEHHRRTILETIGETYEAPLPEKCPGCGGSHLTETSLQNQDQVEIPWRPISREFHVHFGQCEDCGCAVQGWHELQASEALGAADHAAIALLNNDAGSRTAKWPACLKTCLESTSTAPPRFVRFIGRPPAWSWRMRKSVKPFAPPQVSCRMKPAGEWAENRLGCTPSSRIGRGAMWSTRSADRGKELLETTDHGRFVLGGRLRAELERLVKSRLHDVFEFLRQPGIDATNYRAEQAAIPSGDGESQGVGRQPHRIRRPRPIDSDECASHLPSTRPQCDELPQPNPTRSFNRPYTNLSRVNNGKLGLFSCKQIRNWKNI